MKPNQAGLPKVNNGAIQCSRPLFMETKPASRFLHPNKNENLTRPTGSWLNTEVFYDLYQGRHNAEFLQCLYPKGEPRPEDLKLDVYMEEGSFRVSGLNENIDYTIEYYMHQDQPVLIYLNSNLADVTVEFDMNKIPIEKRIDTAYIGEECKDGRYALILRKSPHIIPISIILRLNPEDGQDLAYLLTTDLDKPDKQDWELLSEVRKRAKQEAAKLYKQLDKTPDKSLSWREMCLLDINSLNALHAPNVISFVSNSIPIVSNQFEHLKLEMAEITEMVVRRN